MVLLFWFIHLEKGLTSLVKSRAASGERQPARFTIESRRRYLPAPAAPEASDSIMTSRFMLPLRWLGGYSLNDWMNFPAMACAGTRVQSLSPAQRRYMSDSNGARSKGSSRRLVTNGTFMLVRLPVKRLPSIHENWI